MSITEISDQQLDTHPNLGWSRDETDIAKQRANWLRSLGLVEKRDDEYTLTADGHQFVSNAVEDWAGSDWTPTTEGTTSAATYETTVHAQAVDPKFQATVLARHDQTCPISGGGPARTHRRGTRAILEWVSRPPGRSGERTPIEQNTSRRFRPRTLHHRSRVSGTRESRVRDAK